MLPLEKDIDDKSVTKFIIQQTNYNKLRLVVNKIKYNQKAEVWLYYKLLPK